MSRPGDFCVSDAVLTYFCYFVKSAIAFDGREFVIILGRRSGKRWPNGTAPEPRGLECCNARGT